MHPSDEKPNEVRAALNQSLKLLAIRNLTHQQLAQRLKDKGFSETIVHDALECLKNKRLVDDEEFAQRFLEKRLTERPMAKICLESELEKRGVPRELIQKVLEAIGPGEERNLAFEAGRRKAQALKSNEDIARKKEKVFRCLAQRGFEEDLCWEVVEDIIA